MQLSVASGSARAHVDVTLRRIHLHDVRTSLTLKNYPARCSHAPPHVFKIIITPEDIPLGRGKPEVRVSLKLTIASQMVTRDSCSRICFCWLLSAWLARPPPASCSRMRKRPRFPRDVVVNCTYCGRETPMRVRLPQCVMT
jgi:hypothetical protein